MIQSNELRVGSFYNYNDNPIKLDGSLLATYLQNDTDLYLYPIPLNKEWILKFEFELMKESEHTLDTYSKKGFQVWNKNSSELLFICNSMTIYLKFVHQLQNLYFALTNNELNIKTNE